MNKAQLVTGIAAECRLTKADVNRVLDAFVAQVTKMLRRNERVTLVGFGTFTVMRRRSKRGSNPRTHTPMKIAGRRVPRFSAGKELRAAIR